MKTLEEMYEANDLSKSDRLWSDHMIEMMLTARKHVRISQSNCDVSEDTEGLYDI